MKKKTIKRIGRVTPGPPCAIKPTLRAEWLVRGTAGFGYLKADDATATVEFLAYGIYPGANNVVLNAAQAECLIEQLQQVLAQLRVWAQ